MRQAAAEARRNSVAGVPRASGANEAPDNLIARFYAAEIVAKTADDMLGTSGSFAVVPVEARPTAAFKADIRQREIVAKQLADADFATLVADAKLRGDPTLPQRIARKPLAPPEDPTFPQYYERVQARMLDSGFTLVYTHCSDFFLSSGRRQSVLLTLRDAVGTIGTLATGILALVDFNSAKTQSTVLAVVGLGTTAATATIDIYTQRFLFGAENIDAVRDLTLAAVAAHQAKILAQHQPLFYDNVVRALLDDQAICTPRHIALLTRRAIAQGAGAVEASTRGGEQGLAAQVDADIRARLTTTLGLSAPISDENLLTLWWLGTMAPDDAERAAQRASFPGLSAAEPTAATLRLLDALSPALQATLRERVANKRLEVARAEAKTATRAQKAMAEQAVIDAQKAASAAAATAQRLAPTADPAATPATLPPDLTRPPPVQPTTVDVAKAPAGPK